MTAPQNGWIYREDDDEYVLFRDGKEVARTHRGWCGLWWWFADGVLNHADSLELAKAVIEKEVVK